nr:flagellar biosynthesis regulator FlaF [Lentibacter algarum]
MAKNAYSSQAAPVRTDRGAEYEAFVAVTRKLQAAISSNARTTPQLAEALDMNRKLWTILATDAAGEGNLLPDAMRAGIISLYEFTRTQSSKVLRGEAGVQPLIEINAAIMRGLNGGGKK